MPVQAATTEWMPYPALGVLLFAGFAAVMAEAMPAGMLGLAEVSAHAV